MGESFSRFHFRFRFRHFNSLLRYCVIADCVLADGVGQRRGRTPLFASDRALGLLYLLDFDFGFGLA